MLDVHIALVADRLEISRTAVVLAEGLTRSADGTSGSAICSDRRPVEDPICDGLPPGHPLLARTCSGRSAVPLRTAWSEVVEGDADLSPLGSAFLLG